MSTDTEVIGAQKVISLANGEKLELKNFWQNEDTVIVFFRRWGCMLCRLWAKELSEIAPVLNKNGIKLVGVGVEEVGSKEFIDGKYFEGDLYYVENQATYNTMGYKRFNVITILASLLWKQSRDAISKGRSMGLQYDVVGDGLQNGGVLLVRKGGIVLHNYVQLGPAEWMKNHGILELYGLEGEYKSETMGNKEVDARECTTEVNS